MRLGIIRVLTTDDRELLDQHGEAIRATYGCDTVSACILDQPRGVFFDETFTLAEPKVVALARQLEPDVDALVVSCAADPGVSLAHTAVGVPVHGAGSAAARAALALSEHVGVLDLTTRTPASVTDILGDRLVAALVPDGVRETRDLLTPVGRAAAVQGAHILVERDADVVMFACTGMTTINLRATLRDELDVPVVDSVLAAAAAALGMPVMN